MKTIKIVSIVLLFFLNISSAFSQAKNSKVENPVEYFNKRNEAISLAKSEKWKELIPILENLTNSIKTMEIYSIY